jgi:transposase
VLIKGGVCAGVHGVDWSERHHDIAIVDSAGKLIAKGRITDDVAGFGQLMQMLAEAGDTPDEQIPVAIETGRGLLVAALRATGRAVYSINPLAVARYRERRTVARSKSDHVDAATLADILRTDLAHHRPLPNDTEQVQAITVLARAHQDAVHARQQVGNQIRSHLRQYFPAAIEAFCTDHLGPICREARFVLTAATTPGAAAKLTAARLRALLRRSGRTRSIDALAERLHAIFRTVRLRHLPAVEEAMGHQLAGLLAQLDGVQRAVTDLQDALEEAFQAHPDADILTSFPGLSTVAGARVLAEIGADRRRFADARAVKAYAGAAPVTRASGRSLVVLHSRVKNQRLAGTGHVWAFASLQDPGARAHYDRRRAAGDGHNAALRNLFNRMLGQLHHCLMTRARYEPGRAWQPQQPLEGSQPSVPGASVQPMTGSARM